MSIAVLTQVYDEARRLAGAGSVVAKGDFRLKKLAPPLEAAGAKAPVFAKVADAVKAVTDGPEADSAGALLELASLVSAVLYTQGETGLAGEFEPITPIDLGAGVVQTSARVLKPLLEALTTTGSGRIEVIKDGYDRGVFRDLRLVRHAVAAIDDPYPEAAEFIATKVLPTYGTAIVPELRAKYDPKGTRGHPRRLELLHKLDPAGARELVLAALDGGSKEVKVAAIGLLGPADLSYLLEQAAAKAQDVRRAAYQALATVDDDAARGVLQKAMTGKDLDLAARAIGDTKGDKFVALLLAQVAAGHDAFLKTKDPKDASAAADRLQTLLGCLRGRDDPATEAAVLGLFENRAVTAKVKGATRAGTDVVERVVYLLRDGSVRLKAALADAHAAVDPDHLQHAVRAARTAYPADTVYDVFAPYVLPGRKKDKAADARQEQVLNGLDAQSRYSYRYYYYHRADDTPLDPRWLDLAVTHKLLGLAVAAARPGHPGLTDYLDAEFAARLKAPDKHTDIDDLVGLMIRLGHPAAVDRLLTAAEKLADKKHHTFYWMCRLVGLLPKAAVPALEAFVPTLKEGYADQWVDAVQQLRDKPDAPPSA